MEGNSGNNCDCDFNNDSEVNITVEPDKAINDSTQSPKVTYEMKYKIILEQPHKNRKFALSIDETLLYVLDFNEKIICEYCKNFSNKSENKEDGNFLDQYVILTSYEIKKLPFSTDCQCQFPMYCQLKHGGITKNYKFEKVNRVIGERNAF